MSKEGAEEEVQREREREWETDLTLIGVIQPLSEKRERGKSDVNVVFKPE